MLELLCTICEGCQSFRSLRVMGKCSSHHLFHHGYVQVSFLSVCVVFNKFVRSLYLSTSVMTTSWCEAKFSKSSDREILSIWFSYPNSRKFSSNKKRFGNKTIFGFFWNFLRKFPWQLPSFRKREHPIYYNHTQSSLFCFCFILALYLLLEENSFAKIA